MINFCNTAKKSFKKINNKDRSTYNTLNSLVGEFNKMLSLLSSESRDNNKKLQLFFGTTHSQGAYLPMRALNNVVRDVTNDEVSLKNGATEFLEKLESERSGKGRYDVPMKKFNSRLDELNSGELNKFNQSNGTSISF